LVAACRDRGGARHRGSRGGRGDLGDLAERRACAGGGGGGGSTGAGAVAGSDAVGVSVTDAVTVTVGVTVAVGVTVGVTVTVTVTVAVTGADRGGGSRGCRLRGVAASARRASHQAPDALVQASASTRREHRQRVRAVKPLAAAALVCAAALAAPRAAVADPDPPPQQALSRGSLFAIDAAVAAGGLVLGGVGIAFSARASSYAAQVERACASGCTAASVASLDSSGRGAQRDALLAYAVSAAALTGAVAMFIAIERSGPPDVAIAPSPTIGGAMVSAQVRF
jgi:hypothetical protein